MLSGLINQNVSPLKLLIMRISRRIPQKKLQIMKFLFYNIFLKLLKRKGII